jgi:Domain of Unknown Function (DUF1521)
MTIGGVRGHDYFQVHGNTIETRNYEITASKGDFGEVLVRDKATGKTFWSKGDPYLLTGDGDSTSYQNGNVTVNLPDGSKLTLDPTDNPGGRNTIERAVYTKGRNAAVITFDSAGNPTTRELRGQGRRVDLGTPDGLDLDTRRGSIDDLKVRGGPEIKGRDIANLDVYRNPRYPGGGRPHIGLPNWRGDCRPHIGPPNWHGDGRPHIGLPNWRAHGPFGWWGRHASGPHHRTDNCESSRGDGKNWRIGNLLDQIRGLQWQASHGPREARVYARYEIRRLEHQLRGLTA